MKNSLSMSLKVAKTSRDQACWIDPHGRWAVTDPIGSYPVYYHPKYPERGFSPAPWNFPFHGLSPAAWRSFCAYRGVLGPDAFPEGILRMPAATMGEVVGNRLHFKAQPGQKYRFTRKSLLEKVEASRAVFDIGTEYLQRRLRHEMKVVLFFSSGTDSVVCALMLIRAGIRFRAVTADYGWERYSEYPSAKVLAEKMGFATERIRIRARDYWNSLLEIHKVLQDCTCSNASSMIWHSLARQALQGSTGVVVTGDHADSLFLGFQEMHAFMPDRPSEYWKKEVKMSPSDRAMAVFPTPTLLETTRLWKIAGLKSADLVQFLKRDIQSRRQKLLSHAKNRDLPFLQQKVGQEGAGIPWQHNFLFVERALPGVRFVSPFYDPKMIQFAMAMDSRCKAGEGVSKKVLRILVSEKLGETIHKKASPFPLRIWTFAMPIYVWPYLLPRFWWANLSEWVINLSNAGKKYTEVLQLAATCLWIGKIAKAKT